MPVFFNKKILFLSFLPLLLGVLSSCDQEKMDFCKGETDQKYTGAISELSPDLKRYKEDIITIDYQRLPASSESGEESKSRVVPMEHKFRLPKKEREKWQAWSEVELKKVQTYIDEVRGHAHESEKLEKISEHLKTAANQLVAFHGYCQQSRVDRMIASLKEVEQHRVQLKKLSCN